MGAERDHRREERIELYGDVAVQKHVPGEKVEAFTVNVSTSGLSIITKLPLEMGATVTINAKGMWDAPRIGTVVWVKQLEENLHQAGLKLLVP